MTVVAAHDKSIGRVLCVTSNCPRWLGDSTTPFVLHLAADLQALGWHVDIIAPHAPGAARREQLQGVAITRFRYAWPLAAQQLCYRGGAVVNLQRQPHYHLLLPSFLLAEWLAVQRQLRRHQYDVLHSHWIVPQGFIGRLARIIQPGIHVITAHGGDVFALRGAALRASKRFALTGADAVTVNSSVTEAAVRQLAPRQPAIYRIPMGVTTAPLTTAQLDQSAAVRAQYRRDAGPLLIFAGRLVAEKGMADLLHALALVRPTLPDAQLLCIGAGPEQAALVALTRQLQLAAQVQFLGWIAPAELPMYFHAADICIVPSRTAATGWQEAQGLVALEAMAVGTPVIATAHGGLVDSVRAGDTGLLVPEATPAALAAAIVQLHRDSALATRCRQAALAHVTAHYSRSACAAQFAALFAQLVRQRHSQSQ